MKCLEKEDVIRAEKTIKKGSTTIGKTLKRAVSCLFYVVMVLIAATLIFSLVNMKVSGGPPAIAGYRMYIVLSGSMSPAFEAGSLIFVKPMEPEGIKDGDIITYRGLGEDGQLISHRVVTVNNNGRGISFSTKGDANEVMDPNPVAAGNLVGKVVLAVPYFGFFMDYAKTKQGILTLVFVPAFILLVYESVSLYRHVAEKNKEAAAHAVAQGEGEEDGEQD